MEKRKAYTVIGILSLIIVTLLIASFFLGYFLLVSRNEIAFQELAMLDLNEQLLSPKHDSETNERQIICEDNPAITPDYSRNIVISDSLKKWVEDNRESIRYKDWNVLWDDSNTTMHHLVGENLHYFLVFFDEPNQAHINGVFWVWGQCWLDLATIDESRPREK